MAAWMTFKVLPTSWGHQVKYYKANTIIISIRNNLEVEDWIRNSDRSTGENNNHQESSCIASKLFRLGKFRESSQKLFNYKDFLSVRRSITIVMNHSFLMGNHAVKGALREFIAYWCFFLIGISKRNLFCLQKRKCICFTLFYYSFFLCFVISASFIKVSK